MPSRALQTLAERATGSAVRARRGSAFGAGSDVFISLQFARGAFCGHRRAERAPSDGGGQTAEETRYRWRRVAKQSRHPLFDRTLHV